MRLNLKNKGAVTELLFYSIVCDIIDLFSRYINHQRDIFATTQIQSEEESYQ